MKKIGSFFKLVRWPNLLITALMMCLVFHCIMMMQSTVSFTLLVISMVFIVAGGYVINDIFDMETDAINKPKKLIVGKVFSEKQCNVFYWTLTIIGLCCGLTSTIMALGSKFYMIFACLLLLSAILYSYSKTYKKKLLIGNVIVSLSVAFAVFLPWLFVMLYMSANPLLLRANEDLMTTSLRIVLFYSAFAFLTTLIREIVKDMEDVDGDGRTHCRTIPVVLGLKKTSIIVIVLLLLMSGTIFSFENFFENISDIRTPIILIEVMKYMFIGLMAAFMTTVMQKPAKPEKTYHIVSILLKITMLIGILTMIFINF